MIKNDKAVGSENTAVSEDIMKSYTTGNLVYLNEDDIEDSPSHCVDIYRNGVKVGLLVRYWIDNHSDMDIRWYSKKEERIFNDSVKCRFKMVGWVGRVKKLSDFRYGYIWWLYKKELYKTCTAYTIGRKENGNGIVNFEYKPFSKAVKADLIKRHKGKNLIFYNETIDRMPPFDS